MSTIYTPNPANNPASITIPSDGDAPIKAADVDPAFEGLADKIAYTMANYLAKAGGTLTGAITFGGASVVSFLNGFSATGKVSLRNARVQHRAPQRPADAAVVNIDTTVSDVYHLPPAAAHIALLQVASASSVVQQGERVLVTCPGLLADGLNWHVKSEGAADVIADLYGSTVDVSGASKILNPWVLCQFEGSAWRGIAWGGYVEIGAGW